MHDQEFLEEAYKEALLAKERGECPIGAVIVNNGKIVGRAGNEEVAQNDPTAHAEILAMRRAGQSLKQRKFPDCVVYTTLWPCPMCDAALLQAQVARVVSGARSLKWIKDVRFNQDNMKREGPLMEDKCKKIFLDWARVNRPFILEYEGLE